MKDFLKGRVKESPITTLFGCVLFLSGIILQQRHLITETESYFFYVAACFLLPSKDRLFLENFFGKKQLPKND